eukprot:8689936-Alexandrium_andersonii.AAC.1
MAPTVQRAYAASLLGEPLRSAACVNCAVPFLAELGRPLGVFFPNFPGSSGIRGIEGGVMLWCPRSPKSKKQKQVDQLAAARQLSIGAEVGKGRRCSCPAGPGFAGPGGGGPL